MPPDILRIRRLTVENYRGISNIEIDFPRTSSDHPGTLVLGGPNGSGKTSLLEAALLGVNADEALLRPSSRGEQAVRKGASDFHVVADIELDGRPFKIERSRRSSPRIPKPRVAYFSSWRAQKYVGGLSVTAGRPGRKPDPKNEENRLWIIKQFLINSRMHFLFRESKNVPPKTDGRVGYEEFVERFNRIWSSFYPHDRGVFKIDEVSDDPEAGFDLFLQVDSNLAIPIDSLSSGQQELVAMFGWFISQQLDGGLIVIDEPELHLDQTWHRVMMRSMQSVLPNSQFIVATHSSEIYDSAYSFERRFLTPPEASRNTQSRNAHAGES